MHWFHKYCDFVKWLNKQTLRVKMRRGKQRVYFNKGFHSQKNLLSLEHIDELVDKGEILKRGNSTTVSKVELNDQTVVIKRYNTNSIWSGIKQLVKVTYAYNCWFIAHWLRWNNISTPKPLAVVELKLGFLWKRSYLITEYAPFCSLDDFLQDPTHSEINIDKTEQRIRVLFSTLRKAHVSHGDFKSSNLLCLQDDICLVDLDHAYFHFVGVMLLLRLKRDKKRFLKNFNDSSKLQERFRKVLSK
jgi:serine/threonine-protein kinase RIO1